MYIEKRTIEVGGSSRESTETRYAGVLAHFGIEPQAVDNRSEQIRYEIVALLCFRDRNPGAPCGESLAMASHRRERAQWLLQSHKRERLRFGTYRSLCRVNLARVVPADLSCTRRDIVHAIILGPPSSSPLAASYYLDKSQLFPLVMNGSSSDH